MWRKTHRGVHDARSVGPDGVCDVTDVDCVEMLVVACFFYEDLEVHMSSEAAVGRPEAAGVFEPYLVVQVIEVAGDKYMYVSHDLQNIQTLMRADGLQLMVYFTESFAILHV